METLAQEHQARRGQLPRLIWVMARAYAPRSPLPLHWLVAVSAVPAYLMILVNAWSAGTLLSRPDGRAMLTATPVSDQGKRRETGWGVVPVFMAYLAVVGLASGSAMDLVDQSPWVEFLLGVGVVVMLTGAILVPMRPLVHWSNRRIRQALKEAQSDAAGPHWDLDDLASWPHGHGYGVQLLRDLQQGATAQGTGWLLARDHGLARLYQELGCTVVPDTGGRGMRIQLGAKR